MFTWENIKIFKCCQEYKQCTYKSMYKTILCDNIHMNYSHMLPYGSMREVCACTLGLLEALSLLLVATEQLTGALTAVTDADLHSRTPRRSRHSSAEEPSAMLCSCAMAASSFRNSAYRMMANTRLLA